MALVADWISAHVLVTPKNHSLQRAARPRQGLVMRDSIVTICHTNDTSASRFARLPQYYDPQNHHAGGAGPDGNHHGHRFSFTTHHHFRPGHRTCLLYTSPSPR